jgi:hypothetical protein
MGFKKEYKIYGDMLFQHKPTIRSLLLYMFYSKFIKRERTKLPVYREDAEFKDPDKILEGIETKYIALVSEGNVKELIRLQKFAADILLDKKTKLVEFDPQKTMVKKGMTYKNNKFVEEEPDEKN